MSKSALTKDLSKMEEKIQKELEYVKESSIVIERKSSISSKDQ